MSFIGDQPYGTDGGTDGLGDTSGTTVLRGYGEGAEYFLTTNDTFTVRNITSITEIIRVLPASGTGSIPTSGGSTVGTIILNKNGVAIDSAMGTLDVNSAFNAVSSPAGTVSLALAFLSGGLFGSASTPARSDHSHVTGGIKIAGPFVHPYTSPVTVGTVLTVVEGPIDFEALTNNTVYDLAVFVLGQGSVTTGDELQIYAQVSGDSSTAGMSVQTVNGERPLMAIAVKRGVTGNGVSGQHTMTCKAKCLTLASGRINSVLLFGLAIPRS